MSILPPRSASRSILPPLSAPRQAALPLPLPLEAAVKVAGASAPLSPPKQVVLAPAVAQNVLAPPALPVLAPAKKSRLFIASMPQAATPGPVAQPLLPLPVEKPLLPLPVERPLLPLPVEVTQPLIPLPDVSGLPALPAIAAPVTKKSRLAIVPGNATVLLQLPQELPLPLPAETAPIDIRAQFDAMKPVPLQEELPILDMNTFLKSTGGDEIATYQNIEEVPDPATLAAYPQDARIKAMLQHGKWRFTPLYRANTKGSPMVWWVGFDFRTNELLMGHGYTGTTTPIQVTRTRVEENQSGRSIHQQALLEARQRYLKKYRNEGYRPPGEQPPQVDKPMLANKWVPGKTRLKFPVYVQPKLDGARCMVRRVGDNLVYRSRGNRVWGHLNEEFDPELNVFFSYIPYIVELDGEMYLHGKKFTQFASILKNERVKHAELKDLNYWIYDFNSSDGLPYEQRYQVLKGAYDAYIADGHKATRFQLVFTGMANSKEDIQAWHARFRSEGYEGTMIRKLAGNNPSAADLKASLYKSGRGNNLLKYKDIEDEEGTVVGVESAQGTEEGAALLVIRDPRGNDIRMRPAYPVEERRLWMQNPSLVMGKKVTYEFQELSEYGIPRNPVMKAFRDYED